MWFGSYHKYCCLNNGIVTLETIFFLSMSLYFNHLPWLKFFHVRQKCQASVYLVMNSSVKLFCVYCRCNDVLLILYFLDFWNWYTISIISHSPENITNWKYTTVTYYWSLVIQAIKKRSLRQYLNKTSDRKKKIWTKQALKTGIQ